MLAASLTILLCFISALSKVILKKGLTESSPIVAMALSLIVGFVVLSFIAIPHMALHGVSHISLQGVLVFAGIGVIAPPVVRYLSYIGIHRLGASKADPIRSSQPFFAIFLGILVFQEVLTWKILVATILVFIGILNISLRGRQTTRYQDYARWDVLFPLGAAIIAGAITVTKKIGMDLMPDSIVGAYITTISALLTFSIFLTLRKRWSEIRCPRRSFYFLLASGILASMTDILDLLVLKMGKISIIAPLLSTTPLFVLLLSHLFLKTEEKITARVWMGTGFVIAAVQLLFWESL